MALNEHISHGEAESKRLEAVRLKSEELKRLGEAKLKLAMEVIDFEITSAVPHLDDAQEALTGLGILEEDQSNPEDHLNRLLLIYAYETPRAKTALQAERPKIAYTCVYDKTHDVYIEETSPIGEKKGHTTSYSQALRALENKTISEIVVTSLDSKALFCCDNCNAKTGGFKSVDAFRSTRRGLMSHEPLSYLGIRLIEMIHLPHIPNLPFLPKKGNA